MAMQQDRRRYDSTGRRRQAQANRDAVAAAARHLFVDGGYANTSIADIASEAGVSQRTVFVAFTSKVGLLKYVLDTAIAGDAEPVTLHERPVMRRFHEAKTIESAFAVLADAFAEVSERAYDLYAVVHRAADSEPQIAALEHDLDDQRWTGVGHLARTTADLLGVVDPADLQHIRDTLWTLGSPLQYGLLVRDRGWTRQAYRDWMLRALTALVPPPAPSAKDPAAG